MKRFLLLALPLVLMTAPLAAQDIPLAKILVDKEGWREVAAKLPKVTFLEADPVGSVDIYQSILQARIVAGKLEKAVYDKSKARHMDQTALKLRNGRGFTLDVANREIFNKPVGDILGLPGLKSPSCIILWPDEGHLVIAEADGAYLWAVRIEKNGSFGPGDRYYSLRTKPNEKMHVTAMVMDAGYLLYACTPLGIQVFDPTGRLSGVIPNPSKEPMSAITIGGAKADELFVAAGDKIYARRIQGKASYTLKK